MATTDSFIFYASFFEALEDVPAEEYKECITILSNYALNGEEPEQMSPYAKMFFRMAKPQIDANTHRRESGKRGGEAKASKAVANSSKAVANSSKAVANSSKAVANSSKAVANSSKGVANSSKGVANAKQNVANVNANVNANENANVNANENANGGTPYPLSATPGLVEDIEPEQIAELGVDIYAAEPLSAWIKSRAEKQTPISESDFKALISTIKETIQKHGVTAVRKQIQESMANGYKGLCLDRLDQKPRERAAPDSSDVLGGLTDSASKFLARGGG